MENKREQFIDISRGICILLVVLGHELTWDDPFRYAIYSFHIPAFFFLTGLLMSSKDYRYISVKTFVLKSISSLIRPYIIFSGIYILYDLIRIIVFNELSINGLLADAAYTITLYGINVLWFLTALFGCRILLFIIVRRNVINKWIEICVSIIIGLLVITGVEYIYSLKVLGDTDFTKLIASLIIGLARPIVVFPFALAGYHSKSIITKIKESNFILVATSCMIFWAVIPMLFRYKVTLVLLISSPIWAVYL